MLAAILRPGGTADDRRGSGHLPRRAGTIVQNSVAPAWVVGIRDKVSTMPRHRTLVRRRSFPVVLLLALLAACLVPTGSGAVPVAQAAAAAAGRSPAQAVHEGVLNAAANGITQYVSVIDRSTGQLVARTTNADEQVASESIMKMYLAAYYLVLHGGYQATPQATLDRLATMIRYSDDPIASQLFTASAIPTIAARYGMGSTINATDRVGHWGAARITASDVTTFLWRASQDPAVGPWLIPVLAQTTPAGSDGFNQTYGLQALSGVKGSKQGWGGDSFWTAHRYAVHSVGYTDRWFVAVLSIAPTYPDPARGTLSTTAALVQSASYQPPPDGTFVRNTSTGQIFRIAGGAPVYVSNWTPFGGEQPVRQMGAAEIAALPAYPADGTFIAAGGRVYRIAGGAPLYVSSWAPFGGQQPYTVIDPAAVAAAGLGDVWRHLRLHPADGTFIAGGGRAYRIAGGAPVYISSWAPFGGQQPYTEVDPAAITMAGGSDIWRHLRVYPTNGTFVAAGGMVYRMAGGAPIYVTSWAPFGPQPYVTLDPVALTMAGSNGVWRAIRSSPIDGTALRGAETGKAYRVWGGRPFLTPGQTGTVSVSQVSIDRAGGAPPFHFLRR